MSNILTNNINPRSGNLITIGGTNDKVSIAGTLTYEDVSNIDSVGIITAQAGIRVTGGDLSIEGSASQILSIFCNDTGVQATPRTFINLYGDNTANEKKLQAQIASAPGNVASSAGELHFSTNNSSSVITRRMTIDQDGDVGIGTASPGEKLHVSASSPALLIEATNTSSGESKLQLGKTGNTNIGEIKYSHSDNSLSFRVNDGEKMRIDSSGNLLVGIYQKNPSTDLVEFYSKGADVNQNLLVLNGGTTAFSGTNDSNIYQQILFRACAYNSTENISVLDAAAIRFQKLNSWNTGTGVGGVDGTLKFLVAGGTSSSTTLVERMRISDGGQMSTFTTSGIGHRIGHASTGNDDNIIQGGKNASSIANMTTTFYVKTDGDVQNTNNSYTGISDIKLKENIVDANSQWNDLKALQVRNYNFKTQTGFQTYTQLGLIAQEVELVSPGLVSEFADTDGENNDLGTTTKSVNYSVLYMKAVKALQEAMGRIETLEQRLTDAGL